MAYLKSHPECSTSCACAKCALRSRLGEWYVRDDVEEDDRPLARPTGRSTSSAVPSASDGRDREGDHLGWPGMHGFAQTATPFDAIGGFAFDKSDLGPPQHTKVIALARHIMARALRAVQIGRAACRGR